MNCYLRAIRAAFNRWVNEGLLSSTPFTKVRVPKAPKKVIPIFSQEQLRAFFAAIDPKTPEGCRDYALFSTYLDTGCRLREVTRLKMGDLDLEHRLLHVQGKGGRERLVPFGAEVQKALWKYLHTCRPEPAMASWDYFFLTRQGRRLTNNRVEEIMKKYGCKAGIQGVRCSPTLSGTRFVSCGCGTAGMSSRCSRSLATPLWRCCVATSIWLSRILMPHTGGIPPWTTSTCEDGICTERIGNGDTPRHQSLLPGK